MSPLDKREYHLIFVVDSSSFRTLRQLEAFNLGMSEISVALQEEFDNFPSLDLKLQVVMFSTATPSFCTSPISLKDFTWLGLILEAFLVSAKL
jgi:hypothetical protein